MAVIGKDLMSKADREKEHKKALGRPNGTFKKHPFQLVVATGTVSKETKIELERIASLNGFTLRSFIGQKLTEYVKNLKGEK
jgi:hypothetical protein